MASQRILPTKGAVTLFTSEWPYTRVRTFMSLQIICQISVYQFHTGFIILLDALLCCRSFDRIDTPTSLLDLRHFRQRPFWKIVVKLWRENEVVERMERVGGGENRARRGNGVL